MKIFIIVLLCILNYSAGEENIECIRNLQDFNKYDWRTMTSVAYVESSLELPGEMKGALSATGIFYIDGLQQTSRIQRIYKPLTHIRHIRPAFVYIRYYGHVLSEAQQGITAQPVFGDQELPHAPDFTWREAFREFNMSLIAGPQYGDANAAYTTNFTSGDFLLVDTIILVQGINITDIDQIKSFCPPEELPNTPLLECIDTNEDFQSHEWLSYPPHKYASDSSTLPEGLRNLGGDGIFYFDHMPSLPHRVMFKDYTSLFEGKSGPVYIYLKYYVHLSGNNSQSAYVQPVHLNPGEHSLELLPSQGFMWQEKLIEVDTNNSAVGALVETGVFNVQQGDLFLIDKIIVSRSSTLAETLQQLYSCL